MSLADRCQTCGHSHYSPQGSVKWKVSALRCPEFVRLCLAMWDDGVSIGVASYKPVATRHGRCYLKESGVCVWQREPDHLGVVRCSSPDSRPALWSMDRDPLAFFMQQCPSCRHKYVFSHRNKFCPNKACANKRPWTLQVVDTCRYFRRPETAAATAGRGAAARVRAIEPPEPRVRAQRTRPREAVYVELRAVMLELAASRGGFVCDGSTMERLATMARRRARARDAARAMAQTRPGATHVSVAAA